MPPLPVTAATAALLGLLFVVLIARVIMARGKTGASLGDGSVGIVRTGQESTMPLLVASRSHANFAEHVPFALFLLALVEISGAARWFVCLIATMLLLGRLAHPFGMGRKIPNPYRAAGAILTVLTIAVASLYLLAIIGRAYIG
jgi:uncharacterized membrane protein YecN with MAPEG domain